MKLLRSGLQRAPESPRGHLRPVFDVFFLARLVERVLRLCPALRARVAAAFLPDAVRRVAFSPPIAGELSRRPFAPTWDLPSVSCWEVRFFALRQFSRFSFGLSYLEAPASFNAMAIACRRLFTLPPFPSGPLLSSPCSYSCMTRPIVLRCLGDVLGISHLFRVFLSLSGPTPSRLPRFRPPTSRDRPRTEELATRRAVAMSQSKRGFDGI